METSLLSDHSEPPDAGAWMRDVIFQTPDFMSAPWFADSYHYLVDHPGQPTGMTTVRRIDDPDAYDAHNLRDLFSMLPPVFEEQASAVAARQRAAPAPPDRCWFPNVIAMFPGYVSAVLAEPNDVKAGIESLLRSMEEWARGETLKAVAFPYVDRRDLQLVDALHAAGYRRSPMTSRSVLGLEPGTFEGSFLAPLGGKRASEIRREIRRLADRGIEIEELSLGDADLERLLDLRVGLIEKYGHGVDYDKESTRMRWLASLGDKARVYVASDPKGVCGFTLFLHHGNRWIAYMTGADPCRGRGTYFATSFYSPVRTALESAVEPFEIDFGIGHAEAKVRRGCKSLMLDGWLLPLDRGLAEWANKQEDHDDPQR